MKTKFKYYLASGGGVVVVGGGGVVTPFLGNSQMKLWSELQVETYQYPSRSLSNMLTHLPAPRSSISVSGKRKKNFSQSTTEGIC